MEKCEWQKKGQGHRQRLRDKFLEQGIEAFTDSEIIELLLTFGTPRSDCKEAARLALAQFKSLPAVLDASSVQLQRIKGLGPKNIFALQFIQGVARRYLRQRVVGRQYVHSSREVADYLIHTMRGLQHEVFTVVFLDAAHAVIDSAVVAEGTITINTIYPRELVKAALAHNAAALVVAHNHPSGSLTPSRQDEELTRTLHLVCSFMHINLLDHLIIGSGDQVYSFADQGIMAKIRDDCRQIVRQVG
ncbi:RadC family protein [Desulfobulbus oligotrophicus]|uniref:DNA repair protein RadC n=1 Tax=Desulfobulbus oligotrophicus TaxID=1909699 RepID=A0A7T5VC16_9BACT|nr:DNA repair protein RadC [Desulfobulbus oligotrophicus]QQG65034.1 DNA repair protein RadC [Desulfobulbus oligotrophicus]